jgi:MFS family permease
MGAVVGRFGVGRLLIVGFASLVACYANMLRIGSHGDYLTVILPSVLLVGLSFVTVFPCVNIQATSRVRDSEQGMASGLVNASFQIGAAVGLAAVTAVVLARTGNGASGQLAGYHAGLVAALGIAVLGLVVAAVAHLLTRPATPGRRRGTGPADPG